MDGRLHTPRSSWLRLRHWPLRSAPGSGSQRGWRTRSRGRRADRALRRPLGREHHGRSDGLGRSRPEPQRPKRQKTPPGAERTTPKGIFWWRSFDLRETGGGGGIRTPETGVARLTVFKTVAFNQLCHPSRDDCPQANDCGSLLRELRTLSCTRPDRRRSARSGRAAASKLCRSQTGRGGREAEGTRLLSEYGGQTPSRVRIPPSPFYVARQTVPSGSAKPAGRRFDRPTVPSLRLSRRG